MIELNHNQTTELLTKLKDFTKYLKERRKGLMDSSKTLIECIEKETRRALNSIKDLQKGVVDLMSERSIRKENYQVITNMTLENDNNISKQVEKIKESVESLFEFYYYEDIKWKDCSQVIFSRDTTGGLLSIDLTTFKLSNLDYDVPKIGQYFQACKIDQHTYFVHGGRVNNIARPETYLINIKDKTYKALPNGPAKDSGGGSALKNNKVFIFGGHNAGSVPLNTCDLFDLKTREWKSITALPQASYAITAAVLNKNIILSGLQLSCCYSFNDSTFASILTLPGNVQKLVCEGWIYAYSILYENQDQNPSKWVSHNVVSWGNYLWTYAVFKNNEYLYFIDATNCLMRIDTKLKKLEKIAFT